MKLSDHISQLTESLSKTNEWVEPEEIELDDPETITAYDLDSPEGRALDKGDTTKYRWKDTRKPSDIDAEWLGDLEIDANDDVPEWEKHPDWYMKDSSGNVVRTEYGEPIKTGSHPDSQKKQPWDW